jgi:hypothetical protein
MRGKVWRDAAAVAASAGVTGLLDVTSSKADWFYQNTQPSMHPPVVVPTNACIPHRQRLLYPPPPKKPLHAWPHSHPSPPHLSAATHGGPHYFFHMSSLTPSCR